MSERQTRGRAARRRKEPLAMVCERRYSVDEAAEVSSLSVKMIRKAVAEAQSTRGVSGLWPLEKCGSRVLIPSTTLDNWLKSFRLGDVA